MKMTRKLMLGTAIAAAMASAPAMADSHAGGVVDTLKKDAYVAASVGLGDMGASDDAVIGTLTYGRDLDQYAANLGYEVELTGTLADAEQDVLGTTYEGSYMGLGAYATYGYNLGQHIGVQGLDVYGKAGVAFVDFEIETAIGTYEDDDIDLAYGVGVNYNLQAVTGVENVGLRAEILDNGLYDEVKVGVSYAF